MNPIFLRFIFFSGLVGALAGLARLSISSRPSTTRTVFAFMLTGFMMASCGASLMTFWACDPSLFYGVSVILGMSGEQALFIILELAQNYGNKFIERK